MPSRPKVSVITITYNHEKFIERTLDSILQQKVKFDFEVIVADDCSTDKTATIIREYAKKYPKVIRPILRKKNVGAQHNFKDAILNSTGEYVALCEGDDYWTDSKKLQKQADFLNNKTDYSICFHPVQVIFENKEEPDSIFPDLEVGRDFTLKRLIGQNFIQTNSVMFRSQNYENLPTHILPLDWYLHLYHAQFGKIGFINEVMAVYRRHAGGIWWDTYKDFDMMWKKYGVQHLAMYYEILQLYGKVNEYKKLININIYQLLSSFIRVDKNLNQNLLAVAIEKFPSVVEDFMISQYEEIEIKKEEVENLRLETKTGELKTTEAMEGLEKLRQENSALVKEIGLMKQSKFWKAKRIYSRLTNKSDTLSL